ncbi:MAG: UvrD-helicase domain-containing protein, partial [Acidimicrobiales bacterium]
MSDVVAPDQAERDRISSDLASTLFVEAGAGSGKTRALVDRVVALVTTGEAELRSIAAITFTDKAGNELRDRIRRELENVEEAHPGTDAAERCHAALGQLDAAAIGTLHSFAQRLLSEHPVEAGLPPRVEVLDEVSSQVAFEQRWSMFQDDLLADADFERTLLLLFASGVRPDALRALAQAFEDNWDLVEQQVPDDEPDPPPVLSLVREAFRAVDDVCSTPCRDPGDKLRIKLDDIAASMATIASTTDEIDLIEMLDEKQLPSFKVGGSGRQKSFDTDLKQLQQRVREAGEGLLGVRERIGGACARRIGSAIRRFTLVSAEERQRAGQLQFHDLLVVARMLLRDPHHGPTVRARLHERYRRILLDEFQDTDPIQIELAVRIAAADPVGAAAGS